jgi:hypothetical protein
MIRPLVEPSLSLPLGSTVTRQENARPRRFVGDSGALLTNSTAGQMSRFLIRTTNVTDQ